MTNKKPVRAINDWFLYQIDAPYKNDYLYKQHKKLLTRESGYIFWIDNYFLKKQTKNPLFKEIQDISVEIENQGYYTMYKVK